LWEEFFKAPNEETAMKNMRNSAKPAPRIIDSDGHVRETDNEIIEYMSAGYRARRDAMFFQCGEEMTTRRDVELLGDDCLLWASDFPHEATRTDMKELVKEFFDRKDLARAAKKKIAYDNPKRFYAL